MRISICHNKTKKTVLLVGIFLFVFLIPYPVYPAMDSQQKIKITFPRQLKVDEINFYQIEARNFKRTEKDIYIRIFNPKYKKCEFTFSINCKTSMITDSKGGWSAKGYFFLPNIIPAGYAVLQLKNGQSVIYQTDVQLLPEIVFHSPIFQQGFPPLSVMAETGMRRIIAGSYAVSKMSFVNPAKRSFFFFSVKLKEGSGYDRLKLRIYVKQRILDEIWVDKDKKEYVYCLAKGFVGEIRWLKVSLESFDPSGKPITIKENIYEYEYLSMLPFNGIPKWINSFLKESDFIEDRFRCRQE